MKTVLVWFDGECPVCRREIALMRRLDAGKAVVFLDASRAETACPVDRATLLARFHALEDGRLLSGAAAFAAMWRAIPGLRPFGLLARRRRVLSLLERLYGAFLGARPFMQRVLLRFDRGHPELRQAVNDNERAQAS